MIVVVSAVMSAKLLYDSHGQEILTVGDELMNSTHNYEQLIEIFDSCFADDFNTRLIKGDDEPIYLPADDEVPYNRIIFAHGFTPAVCTKFRTGVSPGKRVASWWTLLLVLPGRARRRHPGQFEDVEVKPVRWNGCSAWRRVSRST